MYYFQDGNLTDLDKILNKVVEELKNQLIEYMLTNHNIKFLTDEVEKELYNIIFEYLEPIILGQILSSL